MKCEQVLEQLSALVYGDLRPGEAAGVEQHLAECSVCRAEHEDLVRVRQLLDAAPTPVIQVDFDRLSKSIHPRRPRRKSRRLKVVAWAATAAAILMAAILNLEFRIDGHQLVVRWGNPPTLSVIETNVEPAPSPPEDNNKTAAPNGDERIRVLNELIHALAADIESRDQQRQQDVASLKQKIALLEEDARDQWAESERSLAALYTAQFGNNVQGEQP